MFSWVKTFPFTHYIIMGAVGLAVFFYGDLALTKQALNNERELRQQWQHAAEVQASIRQRETVIIQASREADRAIQEASDADTEVPHELALAWAAGIDSVRNAGTIDVDKHELPGSGGNTPKRREPDGGATCAILQRPRGGVLDL